MYNSFEHNGMGYLEHLKKLREERQKEKEAMQQAPPFESG